VRERDGQSERDIGAVIRNAPLASI
jgi:hypothetical protein